MNAPDLDQARVFLGLLDPGADAFTFQTFDDSPAKSKNLAKVWHGTLEALAEPLATLNQAGAGVFVTVNETDGKGRKAANIVRVRACFVDLDGAPLEPVMACALQPHFAVESSLGRHHAYWRVYGLPLDQFVPVQKAIAARFGGDPSVHDLSRVMRLPGFWHQKAAPFMTRILRQTPHGEPYSAGQVSVELLAAAAAAAGGTAGSGEELAELVRQIMTAENFHDPLVRLAWRFIKGGMPSGQVIETLQGLLLALPEPHDERWQARFDEIERTVASAEVKHRQLRPALDIILDWMQRRYQPGHRNPDQSFYSIALGVDVPLSKIYADREVLDALRFAIETPRDKGRVKDSQLPVVFTRHKQGAYGELLKVLPSRDEAASGDEEFLRQVGALLAAIVPCDRQSIWTRRALGTWCHWFASQQPDEWCRAGSYFAWGRILSDGFQIAIAQALAGQISPTTHRAIHEMSSVTFGRRCQSGGISTGTDDNRLRADGRRLRVVVLSHEFIDSLFLSTDHSDPQSEALHRNFQGKGPNSGRPAIAGEMEGLLRTDLDSCVEDLSRPRGRDRYVVTRTRTYEESLLATPGSLPIDFETHPVEARAHERQPCVLSLAHENGGTAVVPITASDLPAMFAGRRASLVAHNAQFETEVLLAAGVPADIDCSLIAAKALYLTAISNDRPQPVAFGLADLVAKEFGRQRDKTLQSRDWRAPLDAEAVEYCRADAVDALALWQLYEQRLADEGLLEGYHIIARAALPTAAINISGVYFDTCAHAALIDQLQAEADRLEAELAAIAPWIENHASMQQISAWIMDAVLAGDDSEERLARFCARLQARCGVGWKRGKNGHLAITKSTKAKMAGALGPEFPIVASYLRAHADWTKAAKLLNAFGESLAEFVDGDCRLRGQLRLGGTVTLRHSAAQPNIQQMPRETGFRALFRAPSGRVLIAADFSQIELRLSAILAEDPALLAVYREGRDVHQDVADAIGLPRGAQSKGVSFTLCYGGGVAGVAEASGLDLERAAEVVERFLGAYPGLRAHRERAPREAEALGCIRIRPHRRIIYDAMLSKGTQAINYVVQGGAASVQMRALRRVHDALVARPDLDAQLVGSVHDEILLEAPADERAEAAAALLQQGMQEALIEVFPEAEPMGAAKLTAAQIGVSWAGEASQSGDSAFDAVRASQALPEASSRRAVLEPPAANVERLFDYMNAREAIRLRRQAGDPPPWTADPILRAYKFCEIRPELDRVSRWLRRHWYEPFTGHQNLPLAAAMARLINNTAVLEELGFPETWNAGHTLQVLQDLKARGVPIWTHSYTRCVPPKGVAGGSRERYCVEILDRVAANPLVLTRTERLESVTKAFRAYPGIGDFIAYLIACDLYPAAPDALSWAFAGDGAVKGLNRIWNRSIKKALNPRRALEKMGYLFELAPQYLGAHISKIEMRTIEHNLCELEKYERIRLGQGTGRRYRPSPKGAEVMPTPDDPVLPAAESPAQPELTPPRRPRRRLSPEQRHRLKFEIEAAAGVNDGDGFPAVGPEEQESRPGHAPGL